MNITDACKEIIDKYGKEQQINMVAEVLLQRISRR
jgi:hypothetical protein